MAGADHFEGFEGSYLGNREVLRPGSRLECKICWWVYDPALCPRTGAARTAMAMPSSF
jgi:hypothetical protein